MADFLARSVFVHGERDHGFLFVLLARMDLRPNLSRPSTVRAQEDLQEDIARWVLPIVCCNWDSLPYLYCARMERRAKPTPIMLQLPRDVVQNIFSVKPSGSGQPVLSLQDRVRRGTILACGMVVCIAQSLVCCPSGGGDSDCVPATLAGACTGSVPSLEGTPGPNAVANRSAELEGQQRD